MDWALDDFVLSQEDLSRVFKYEPGQSTVIHLYPDKETGVADYSRRLSVSKRRGEKSNRSRGETTIKSWLADTETAPPAYFVADRTSQATDSKPLQNAQRGLSTVPFSQEQFKEIAKVFNVHSSISRVVSRADIPVYQSFLTEWHESEADNSHEAWGYSLTLAVLFGCTVSIEKQIIKRLSHAASDCEHPMLMAGIIVEIERKRHIELVDNTVDELEARILDLEVGTEVNDGLTQAQIEEDHRRKRSSWLDTTYLRDCLKNWRTQLENLSLGLEEAKSLTARYQSYSSSSLEKFIAEPATEFATCERKVALLKGDIDRPEGTKPIEAKYTWQTDTTAVNSDCEWASSPQARRFERTGYKIGTRTRAIIQEYDEKIRDCTMRIEGMAMATQWAHGETNMEIARATSRDSKHMRSIAFVTMVFLPGTFFAGMFSMTFFDWSGETGTSTVSSYFWIFVVVTILCTLLTIGLWYYFSVYKHAMRSKMRRRSGSSPV